jgi:hypothetical protein
MDVSGTRQHQSRPKKWPVVVVGVLAGLLLVGAFVRGITYTGEDAEGFCGVASPTDIADASGLSLGWSVDGRAALVEWLQSHWEVNTFASVCTYFGSGSESVDVAVMEFPDTEGPRLRLVGLETVGRWGKAEPVVGYPALAHTVEDGDRTLYAAWGRYFVMVTVHMDDRAADAVRAVATLATIKQCR